MRTPVSSPRGWVATATGMLGFEFRPKPWAGLLVGYTSVGVDFGKMIGLEGRVSLRT